jgi:hypothetical protein
MYTLNINFRQSWLRFYVSFSTIDDEKLSEVEEAQETSMEADPKP